MGRGFIHTIGNGDIMKEKFKEPIFSTGDIELRFEDGIVCLYGTEKGLKRLAEFCYELINHPSQGHIHLEDYEILTKESEKGAIAIFDKT